MRILTAGLLAGALQLSMAAGASAAGDRSFVKKAIQGNYAEVALGKLAEQRGRSDGVKSYGKMLASDHSQANEKATALAGRIGVKAPSGPSLKQKMTYRRMAALKGGAFDKQFVDHMVKDHQKDIKDYQQHTSGSGPVSNYAKETLPTLDKHLKTAQDLESKVSSAQ